MFFERHARSETQLPGFSFTGSLCSLFTCRLASETATRRRCNAWWLVVNRRVRLRQ